MNNIKSIIWEMIPGNGPVIAAAIHDGHDLRDEVKEIISLTENERLREEDPFTGVMTKAGDMQIIGLRSRFEIDLNRPREKAVYLNPEDAWGLKVWKKELPDLIKQTSLDEYDAFYNEMFRIFSELKNKFKHFVVLDIHSYNHMREGPESKAADPLANPEVNIGTGTIDQNYWGSIVKGFMDDLKKADFLGRTLDVRENVKFRGGNFSRWINETFPLSGCAIAIEFKKFFMDEWTGIPDKVQLEAIQKILESTIPCIRQKLNMMK